MENNNKSWIIIGLVLIIFILGGYIIYNNNSNTREVLDVTSKEVVDLYNSIDKFNTFANGTNDSLKEYLGYFYRNDNIKRKDLSNQAILMIALENIDVEQYSKESKNGLTVVSIPKNEVKNVIKKIFGNIKYQDEDIYLMPFGFYEYSEKNQTYEMTNNGAGIGYPLNKCLTKIVSASKTDSEININVKMAYSYTEYTDKVITTVYSDLNGNNKILDYVNEYSGDFFVDYSEKFDEYQYSFKKIGDNYQFKSVKKLG